MSLIFNNNLPTDPVTGLYSPFDEVTVIGDKPKKQKDSILGDLYQERFSSNYFCGTQAQIWMGERMLDEVVEIEGVYNYDQTPIYGYASTHFNSVAGGHVLVSGAFTINYKYDGYLWAHVKAGKSPEQTLYDKITKRTNKQGVTGASINTLPKFESEKGSGGETNIITYDDPTLEELFAQGLSDSMIASLQQEYWTKKSDVYTGSGNALLAKGVRPEFIGPLKIEIRDFRLGSTSENYESKCLINVFLNRYSTLRRSDDSPTVELYTFIAQTFI